MDDCNIVPSRRGRGGYEMILNSKRQKKKGTIYFIGVVTKKLFITVKDLLTIVDDGRQIFCIDKVLGLLTVQRLSIHVGTNR